MVAVQGLSERDKVVGEIIKDHLVQRIPPVVKTKKKIYIQLLHGANVIKNIDLIESLVRLKSCPSTSPNVRSKENLQPLI